MEEEERMIYLHQAVTMLKNQTGNQERWLDWVLSQLLNKSVSLDNINVNLSKDIFAILSSEFIAQWSEIQNILESNQNNDGTDYLLSFLQQGRGYALVVGMARIPHKGNCPLQLTVLLLYLVSRLKQKFKEEDTDVSHLDFIQSDVPTFGSQQTERDSCRKHPVRGARLRPRSHACRRTESGTSGFPEEPYLRSIRDREFENLAEYEPLSDRESEDDEEEDQEDDSNRNNNIRVNHINYLQYFDNSDLDSESVVVSCRVAPPAFFSRERENPPPPPSSGEGDREDEGGTTTTVASEVATGADASLLVDLLRICVICTGGGEGCVEWTPATEKDKEIVNKIITVAAELIKVDIGSKLISQLEVRVFLNCVSSLKYTLYPPMLRSSQGLAALDTVMTYDKNTIEHWPAICKEIVHLFHALHGWHMRQQRDFTRASPPRMELATYIESFFTVCKRMVLGLQERRGRLDLSGGDTVQLLQSILALFSDTSLDSGRLWSELGLRVVQLTVYITRQDNRVRVIRAVAGMIPSKKVPPDTYFILVSYLPVNCVYSPVCRAYLSMLERSVENLTDSWHDDEEHHHQEGDTGRPASLQSQRSLDNATSEPKLQDGKTGFGPYLRVLMCKNRSAAEMVISHLETVLCSLRSEMRLQLATEVILPYLSARLVTASPGSEQTDTSVLVSVLDLLCTLVNEQPTAMVLIREQKVWATVKKLGSRAGELSNVCQQIIKTLVLNSHKFKKIRLSEAEAMALQDDENDRINFDERDRNAQYWLFKQLYHVLVQSSNSVLVSGWPDSVHHITSAWQVTLDLVRKVPDFFLFAMERGISDINTRLTDSLLNQTSLSTDNKSENRELASLLSTLVNFQVFSIVNYDRLNEDVLHTNINQIKDNLTSKVFGSLRGLVQCSSISYCRVILAGVLDSSYVTEGWRREADRQEPCTSDCDESGYEADESEDCDSQEVNKKKEVAFRVTFKESFHFFIDCYIDLFKHACSTKDADFLYTLEYLMYRLLHNCAACKENATLFNEENALTRLLAELHSLLEANLRLTNLCEMMLVLTGQVARVQILPATLSQIFKLVSRKNQLQEHVLVRVSSLLRELSSGRSEYPGVVVMPQENRFLALSASSSDSGLESTHSSAVASPVPCENPYPRSYKFHEDLGSDYAVMLRIKLAPAVKQDCWLTMLTIESNSQTVGLHINVKKGLKLTLANSTETIAAAETTFKSMLFPDKWIHLAFNLGTIIEGKRETKTLTAYVNCHKVWGVGLSVDKVQTKMKRKETTVTVGPTDPLSDTAHSSLIYSDIHLLHNCILSQENVVLSYICGPRDLNGLYSAKAVCFEKIQDYLPDLLKSCTKIIAEPKILSQHFELAKNVVAHFSPFSYWRKVCYPNNSQVKDGFSVLGTLERVGGAECIVMMGLQVLDHGFSNKTIIETVSNTIAILTANQTMLDDFIRIGSFNLISSILSSKILEPNIEVLHMLLQSSCVDVGGGGSSGGGRALFHPELVTLCLQLLEHYPATRIQAGIIVTSRFLAELVNDLNPCLEFNLETMKKHKLFDDILLCLHNINESEEISLCEEDVSEILSTFPMESGFMMNLVRLILSTIPPNLLYLPHLSRSLLHVTMVKERRNEDLIDKIHKHDVVDASSALLNPPDSLITRLSEETAILSGSRASDDIEMVEVVADKSPINLSEKELDMEYLQTEEEKVTEWEVLTRPSTPSQQTDTPTSFMGEYSLGNLASVLLHKILASFTILSDTESSQITKEDLKPEIFFPLVGHHSSEVHSTSLDIIGLILERSGKALNDNFKERGGYYQLAALIQDAPPSNHIISSTLSLLHGHPVDVNIPFEFNKQSPPQLKLEAACLIPPLIVSSLSYLSLGHNLLCHVHELLANIPELASNLMSEHLLQTLMAGLVKLGDMPEKQSDILGINESELLAEDINNILRMLILFYADKKCSEYDNILDSLFLSSGLIAPASQSQVTGRPKLVTLSEGSMLSLRSGICLILQETLLTIETGLSRTERQPGPRYFQHDEIPDVDQEVMSPNSRDVNVGFVPCSEIWDIEEHRRLPSLKAPSSAVSVSSSDLMSRLNQMTRFFVNYLTSVTSRLLPEEEGLGLSILRLCLDADQPTCIAKGISEAKSLGGTILLQMFHYGTERRKIDLIKILDSRFNILSILAEMYPDKESREHLRFCLLQTMKSSQIFGSAEDAKRCTMFYGRVLCKTLYPEGPEANFMPKFPVHHASYRPWQAECARCVTSFLKQVQKESKEKASVAVKFTESIVQSHDVCRKYFLEQSRDRVSTRQRALRSWRRVVNNQTHPLALWYDPEYEPKSMVLENITGLSGTYIRFKRAHAGLHKERFYKEGFKFKCEKQKQRFSFLFGDESCEENLSNKLDYPEQIQVVESATEVTPTDVLESDIVLSTDKLHVFSNIPWTSRLDKIDSMSKRRYQLKNIALEFFLNSGETHLMVFKTQDIRESFVKLLQDNGICLNPKSDYLLALTKKWRQGLLTNFDYLAKLNSLAGRTPNDLMQYPVFPWILSDYRSEHLDLTNPASFRNLRKPIAIQSDKNREKYEMNYKLLEGDSTCLPGHMGPYHYASHYSNTGIVLHLMVRLPPFTQEFIKFQDGNFDLADRSFHSLGTSWEMVSHVSTSDVKELIPQLFYLPEMFQNDEGFALGKRQNGKDVDNVELPPWAPDTRIFVKIHRQALESSHVKQEISHWIDLVFGFKQRGTAAVEAVNVFHPATYAHNLDKPEDELERRARQTMIATYGQTPLQLFTSPHPLADMELNKEKPSPTPVYRTVTGLKWGNYVGSPAYPSPYVVWQQAQPFQVKSLIKLDNNQVIGLPANTLLVDNSNTATAPDSSFLGPGPPTSSLVSWGHGDSALYHKSSRQGEEVQLCLLLNNDPVAVAASNNLVQTLWFGHKSGRISVYRIKPDSGGGNNGQTKFSLELCTVLSGHMTCLTGLVLSPEYSLAVSAAANGTIMTWDLHSQTCLHTTAGQHSANSGGAASTTSQDHLVSSKVLCAISPSCGDIAVAADSTLTLYTVNLIKVCQTTIRGTITAITFSHLAEGVSVNSVVIGTQGGGVRFYSSWDLTHIRDVAGCPPSPVLELAFSLDCLSLIVASKNCYVTILEKSGSHGLNRTPKYVSVQ